MNFKYPPGIQWTASMGKTLFNAVTAIILAVTFALVGFVPWTNQIAFAQVLPPEVLRKDATELTTEVNGAVSLDLPFENTDDFDFATRGFIDKLPDTWKIPEDGSIWNLEQYQFLLDKDGTVAEIPTGEEKQDQLPLAPASVNPSLWRISQLNMQHGLYEVKPGIYQLRGYDLAEMTLVEGDNGWILIDPLTSNETAEAALLLANRNIGKEAGVNTTSMVLPKHKDLDFLDFTYDPDLDKDEIEQIKEFFPVSAVIYTHSHVDHYAGVEGIIDAADVKSESNPGGVPVYAPEGFFEEAISENVLAGNVMTRRASYMYGNLILKDKKGQVDGGLGKTTSAGTSSLIAPTDIIDTTGEKVTVDGVDIIFQNVPGSEAPAEMMFYFPEYHALCASEDATHTMHNLYTLRGAKVRDPLGWSKYLSETIELFGDNVEVVFASHHWPTWDNPDTEDKNEVVEYLKKQRDLYKYIHDQTLRLANEGQTMLEIAEELQLPDSLAKEWYNRGYYGTLNHNVKAVYQRYLGWFDGNPANLYMLPPEKSGYKYIDYMGGPEIAITKAQEEFNNVKTETDTDKDQGIDTYRWVAKVMSDVVFGYCKGIDPPFNSSPAYCQAAQRLEADALEQLGYMSESGPWRNFFLTGAQELRIGVLDNINAPQAPNLDNLHAMTSEMLFDYMSIRLNGPEAAKKEEENLEGYTFNIIFPDVNEEYLLSVENGVLNYKDKLEVDPTTTIIINRPEFDSLIFGSKQIPPLNPTSAANKAVQQLMCSPAQTSRDGGQKYVCTTMGDTSEPKVGDDGDSQYVNFTYSGDLNAFEDFLGLLDNFEFWFNIVLP
ncbi:MAG: alkyl sulfatase dimerization domain-containing protein [Calothrix sp. MO_192.B10]|nr:alkyl sulfatase dimerization domain-containing protein [Calothrix sp. MO_192.B10]